MYTVPVKILVWLVAVLPALALIAIMLSIFIVGSIIALAIVGIADLALLAFSGLRSIITSPDIQTQRESIYRKAGANIETATTARKGYKHTSLFTIIKDNIGTLIKDVVGLDTVQHGTANVLTGLLKLALAPLAILRAIFFGIKPNDQSVLQKSMWSSKYTEFTYKRKDSSMVKIYFEWNADNTYYVYAVTNNGTIVDIDNQLEAHLISYSTLIARHYTTTNNASYIPRDILFHQHIQDSLDSLPDHDSAAGMIVATEESLLHIIDSSIANAIDSKLAKTNVGIPRTLIPEEFQRGNQGAIPSAPTANIAMQEEFQLGNQGAIPSTPTANIAMQSAEPLGGQSRDL